MSPPVSEGERRGHVRTGVKKSVGPTGSGARDSNSLNSHMAEQAGAQELGRGREIRPKVRKGF